MRTSRSGALSSVCVGFIVGKKEELNLFIALVVGSVVTGSRVSESRTRFSSVVRARLARASSGP